MNEFLLALSSLTTLLNPFMTFLFLFTGILFLINIRNKLYILEEYMKSIAISLQKISERLSGRN